MKTESILDLLRTGDVLPPTDGSCQRCATKHPANTAHAMTARFKFLWWREYGHMPTLADARAHCWRVQ
jgi:hypothetical protein